MGPTKIRECSSSVGDCLMASVDRKRYSSRASIVGADIESCFQRAENSQCFLTQSCDVGMADIAVDLSGVSRVQSKTISSIL